MEKNKTAYYLGKMVNSIKEDSKSETASEFLLALDERLSSKLSPAPDQYLNTKEVCTLFKISKSQIHNLRKKFKDEFPVIRIGNSVRFKQSELETFFRNLNIKK